MKLVVTTSCEVLQSSCLYVCLSVSVRLHISKTKFTRFSVRVTFGLGSSYDDDSTVRYRPTSVFVDDVMSSHNGILIALPTIYIFCLKQWESLIKLLCDWDTPQFKLGSWRRVNVTHSNISNKTEFDARLHHRLVVGRSFVSVIRYEMLCERALESQHESA